MDRAVWQTSGLYDPGAPDASERLELLEYLVSLGWSVEELAANADRLMSLASRRVLFGAEERVTVAQIAALAGCDEALVRRVRLASGLPDPGAEPVCSPLEAEIMSSFAVGVDALGEDETLQFTRMLGAAAAGIAEAALATFATNRSMPLFEGGSTQADVARAGVEATVALLGVPRVLDILLRVHFDAANTGRFSGEHGHPTVAVAVAFVDLVGSTRLTHVLSGSQLSDALGDFERVASDAVVGVGGRVVKRIGDAVMFVASSGQAACDATLAILDAVEAHAALDTVRAAVAFGDVLPRDGDYFGTAVNLAARAVPLADPGTVVVSAEVRDALDSDVWVVTELGDRSLKGFDEPISLFRLHPCRPERS
jgi:class 3 adenylate cyclase